MTKGRISVIIITEVMILINKPKNIKFKDTYLLVLFFGAVSTAAGAVCTIMLERAARAGDTFGISSYPSYLLNELTFSALLHIAVGIILYLDERKKVE